MSGRSWGFLAALMALVALVAWFVAFLAPHDHVRPRMYSDALHMAAALEVYRSERGEYPPNFDDPKRVEAHLRRAVPEYIRGESTSPPVGLDAAQALVYWLSGLNKNRADPFKPAVEKDKIVYFPFAATRLVDGRYYPMGVEPSEPFVYFSAGDYKRAAYGELCPYRRGDQYFAPDAFQIIAPGRDGKLGRGGDTMSPDFGGEDEDNVANFEPRLVGELAAD